MRNEIFTIRCLLCDVKQRRSSAVGQSVKPAADAADLFHYETQSVLELFSVHKKQKVAASNIEENRENTFLVKGGEDKGVFAVMMVNRGWKEKSRQTNKAQCESLVFHRLGGSCQVCCDQPPPLRRLPGHLIPAQTLALSLARIKIPHMHSHISVRARRPAVPFIRLVLPVCFPIMFALCFAPLISKRFPSSPSLFIISASLFLSFFPLLNLFFSRSLIPVYLWDCTPRLAPFQLQAVLMHQLVCCLDSYEVKRAEKRGGKQILGDKTNARQPFFVERRTKCWGD